MPNLHHHKGFSALFAHVAPTCLDCIPVHCCLRLHHVLCLANVEETAIFLYFWLLLGDLRG